MAVDESRRIELFERLSSLVGAEAAHTVFELLPPPGQDVATHDDIVQLERVLRGEVRGEMGELRGEMGELRGEIGGLQGQIAALGERIDASRNEVIATMHQEISRALIVQTRTTVFSMVTALAAISALALGLG